MSDPSESSTGAWVAPIGAITLFVDDLAATVRFYTDVFELPVVYADDDSTVFRFGATLVNLLRRGAAAELVEPATVGDPSAGAVAVFTLPVDDVDVRCARLVERGVTLLNGPIDRPWGPRTASFRDPAGHVWEIAAG
ncbi:MAG: VOC family protein [Actinomycetota bacterium]|nr:VOC family protein [Actinomycetota bacterium]